MARKASEKEAKSSNRLPPLTRLERQVVAYLTTNMELGDYDETGSVEDIAKAFGRDPTRFGQVLNRLVRKGYVTISGGTLEMVYPTVEALRQQDPSLSEKEAARRLARIT